MTYYRFPENRITKAGFALFLFALLYLARDSLVTYAVLGFYKAQFLMLGICGFAMAVFLWYNRKDWKAILTDKRVGLVLLCGWAYLIPMVVKNDWQLMYLSVLVCIGVAVFLSYFVTWQETAKCYVLILAVLSVYSIFTTHFLRKLADNGLWQVSTFYNGNDVEFYNFILSFVSVDYVKRRNFGIFREPGVHQFFQLLGLYLTHYGVQWKKSWHMWTVTVVLSIGMLSTLATGGVVELFLLALVVFFDKKLYRNKGIMAGITIALVSLIAFFEYHHARESGLYWEIYGMTVSKFENPETSVADRLGSFWINIQFFLKNPLVGSRLAPVLYGIENNTSSTTILFAVTGILGGLVHLSGWVALVWEKERKLWVKLSLLVILLMSFNTQNLIADVFLWLFPMMALAQKGLPQLDFKKGRA